MSDVYSVWWRTTGVGMCHPAGPIHWVGAWTDLDLAKRVQDTVRGDWISTGILTLPLDVPFSQVHR